jgi:hypothetical protein
MLAASLGPGRRWPVGVLAVIGLCMVLAPVAFGMFTKAPKGATMMQGFTPFMTAQRLDGFQADMNYIGASVPVGRRAIADLRGLPGGSKAAAKLSPQWESFGTEWQRVNADMGGMLKTIKANLPNYEAVAAMPNFRLFPWFFAGPGAVLLLVAGLGLIGGGGAWRWLRWSAVVVGLVLVLIPIAFQMFTRAPKGAEMMGTFKTIETSAHLERIDGYMSAIAGGQGLVQLQLVPALRHAGLSQAQIDTRYPQLTNGLDAHWIHILNDMTPMLAAMGNNIGNYHAISSLPSFRLFPWFFLLPGVIVIALALVPGRRRPPRAAGVGGRADALSPLSQGVT